MYEGDEDLAFGTKDIIVLRLPLIKILKFASFWSIKLVKFGSKFAHVEKKQ